MRSRIAFSPFLGGALVLGLLVGLGGCAAEERPENRTSTSPAARDTTVADDVIQGTGTIRYVDLEGGFYGIVAEGGKKYDPTPLPDSLREDGLPVRFQLKERDVLTTRMWGAPVEVVHIERIEAATD